MHKIALTNLYIIWKLLKDIELSQVEFLIDLVQTLCPKNIFSFLISLFSSLFLLLSFSPFLFFSPLLSSPLFSSPLLFSLSPLLSSPLLSSPLSLLSPSLLLFSPLIINYYFILFYSLLFLIFLNFFEIQCQSCSHSICYISH